MSKTLKIIFWILVIVIIAVLVWLGGVDNKQQISEGETIKIGVSLPMTGQAVSYGEAALGGVKLAQKEINEKGGVLGKRIELIVEDDKLSGKEAVTIFNKFIDLDKVIGILGPLSSTAASSIIPITKNTHTPTLITGASAPNIAGLSDYSFRNYFSDSLQGKYASDYIYNQLNKRKVAILYIQNDYGQGLRDIFKNNFEELGGEVVFDEPVLQDESDLKTPILKVKESGAEVLFFPVYQKIGIAGLKEIKETGLDIIVFGTESLGEADEVKSVGYSDGLIFSTAVINNPKEFQDKVRTVYDGAVNFVTPFYYDALYIMTDAIERAGSLNKEKIRDELAKTSYEGVALPIIEFDENGDLKEAAFEIRIIKDGQSILYEGQ